MVGRTKGGPYCLLSTCCQLACTTSGVREVRISMKQKVPSRILKFILFNTEWGQREGDEHQKIVYYESSFNRTDGGQADAYSLSNSSFQSAIKDVGLCEALIKFAKSFGDNEGTSIDRLLTY